MIRRVLSRWFHPPRTPRTGHGTPPRRQKDRTATMNLPSRRVGDRYRCFVVIREDRGWGGPYGQYPRPVVWRCDDCGFTIRGEGGYVMARMADHHECGHAPCARCGAKLLRRKDGSPRQHAVNRCPGKNPGDKIEREFIKHMTAREYA